MLSALAFELILTAQHKAGFPPVFVGGLIGGISFVLLNEVLNGKGGFLRKQATTARFLRERRREEVESLLGKLSQAAFLRALPPQDIQAMIPHVESEEYPQGAHIFEQGEPGDAFYLIDQGEIDLGVRRPEEGAGGVHEERIAHLGPGEGFGEMALLTGESRVATAIAGTDAYLLRIPKDGFDELLAVSPGLSETVSQLLARNLQATSLRRPQEQEEDEARQWRQIALRYVETHSLTPTTTSVRQVAQEHASSAPMGIFLGLLLDSIPESLVIGMSMIGAPTVSATLIVALFLANLPEALSSAVGMKAQGIGIPRIVGMWTFLMVFTGVGALSGNTLFQDAPDALIAGFEAAAAGALLTMLAETAMPEAYEQGGWLSGIATLLGFLTAFFVKTLSEG